MFYQLVSHLLEEISASVAELGQVVDYLLNEVESVDLVLNSHIERGGDGTLFLIARNVEVAVSSVIQELVYQRGVAVESEYNRLILGKQRVELGIRQTVRVLGMRLELHKIDDVDESDLYLGHFLAEYRDRRERLEGRGIAAASEHYVRLFALVVARPFPNAYALGVKEQLIFPKIEYDQIDKIRGMDIVICTTAETDEEARELLTQIGAPFGK